jgi:hypothetical protein
MTATTATRTAQARRATTGPAGASAAIGASRIGLRLFSSQQQAAAAGLAAVTTLAVLSAMVSLAGDYQADAQFAQQAGRALAASAPQQVVVTGRRSLRG